jgi:hypothetical protein
VACLGVVTLTERLVNCLGLTVLSYVVLAVLLIIGGVEQNPGPVVEVENTVRLLCTGCRRNLIRDSNANYVDGGIIIVVEA